MNPSIQQSTANRRSAPSHGRLARRGLCALGAFLSLSFAEAAELTVTNNADSGAGSLRDTIAAAASGDTIVFDAALNGQTITLTSGELFTQLRPHYHRPGREQPRDQRQRQLAHFRCCEHGHRHDHRADAHQRLRGQRLRRRRGDLQRGKPDPGQQRHLGKFSLQQRGRRNQHRGGTLTSTGDTISGNSSINSSGGGIAVRNGAAFILTNDTLSQNSALMGGGIALISGSGSLINCTISGNSAHNNAGGMINVGSMTLSDCTISGNRERAHFLLAA